MRLVTLAAAVCAAALFAVAGCGDETGHEVVPDLAAQPDCPPGAEALHGATCRYGVDTSCQSPFGYLCRCLCDGYWECDLVKPICDGGTAHD